jgi:hypothetical protein
MLRNLPVISEELRIAKPADRKKFFFVYQTKNLINGKTYVGVHSTYNVNDGYIGNGIRTQNDSKYSNTQLSRAVAKYGIENFKREILSFYDSEEEAYAEESFIVNEVWIASKDNYNTCLGGKYTFMSSDGRERLSKRMKEKNPMKDKEVALKVSIALSKKMKGRKFSDESKSKMSKASKDYCSQPVLDLESGIRYKSINDCCRSICKSKSYVKNRKSSRFIFITATSCGS